MRPANLAGSSADVNSTIPLEYVFQGADFYLPR